MRRWIAIIPLLACFCGTAAAETLVLTDKDKAALQTVGIAPDDQMIAELSPEEQDKFRNVLDTMYDDAQKRNDPLPAMEAKEFLVTRWTLRKMAAGGDKGVSDLFTPVELKEVHDFGQYVYAYNLTEQLNLYKVMAYLLDQNSKTPHPSSPLLFNGSTGLTLKEKSILQSAGISPNDGMVSELNVEEQKKLKSLLASIAAHPKSANGENAALEAKRFLVTRFAIRKVRLEEKEAVWGTFSSDELDEIKQFASYDYTDDAAEQLYLWTVLYSGK